jgi:menaquinol-cytochrome c reductase iron-sulfur subunit
VVAFTSECPHLGCAVNLTSDGKDFLCPCHTSSFDLDGKPRNSVPPRPMDQLDVEISAGVDPEVRVKFQRFRTLRKEKIPLV